MSSPQKSKPSYFYAIVGVSLVLFLLGVLGWLVIYGRGLTKVLKENTEVQVVFHDNTRPENIDKMKEMLDGQGFVKKTKITTKEEAARLFKEEGGEDYSQLLGSEFNPLYSSIEILLHSEYVNKDSLSKVEQFLKQSNIVREVVYPKNIIEKMNSNFKKFSIVLAVLSVIFIIIAVVLIDNTVRLAMFSNRFLIKTMQMVGATHKFISKPFERRAVINGLIGGVIAVVALWMLTSFAASRWPELKALHDPLLIGLLLFGMIVTGVLISVISTNRSVLKYLKMHVEDLY